MIVVVRGDRLRQDPMFMCVTNGDTAIGKYAVATVNADGHVTKQWTTPSANDVVSYCEGVDDATVFVDRRNKETLIDLPVGIQYEHDAHDNRRAHDAAWKFGEASKFTVIAREMPKAISRALRSPARTKISTVPPPS